MRRIFNDALVSAAALLILLGTLVSFDERVRDYFVQSLRGESMASAGTRLTSVSSALVQAAQERSVEHAAFTLFVLAAVVLVIFMLRT